jgi:hypothetical protein
MPPAQATTWWDDVDDVPGGPVWIVPPRPGDPRERRGSAYRSTRRGAPGSRRAERDPRRDPRRTARPAQEPEGLEERLAARLGDRPDRIALWAPMLGFFLMAVAAASAHIS